MFSSIARYVRRHHLGLIAIFIALGGSAYAASKVESGDIAKDAVKSKHIKDGQVASSDLADGSVASSDLADGSVAAADLGGDSVGGPKVADNSLSAADIDSTVLKAGGAADQFTKLFGAGTAGVADDASGDTCTMGQAELWPGGIYPQHTRIPARGQLFPINQNQALFALFGFTYGGSDNINKFALPDMSSITPNHMLWTICIQGVFP